MKLITSCVTHKSVPIQESLRFDNHSFDEWYANVLASPTKVRAADLYKGAYWKIFKELYDSCDHDAFVISAGCGLININEEIPPYAITFGHPHSRVPCVEYPSVWWNQLCEASEFSLRDLVDDVCLIALGPTYLDAVKSQLQDNHWVITSDSKVSKNLPNTIITTKKYRYAAGNNGGDHTTHVRAMKDIVNAGCATIKEARELIQEIENAAPINKVHNRIRYDDAHMINMIKNELLLNPLATGSSLIEKFRASNIKMSSIRMPKLFKIATSDIS